MLDINFIRENKELVQTVCKNKNVEVDIDRLLKLGKEFTDLQTKIDQLRQKRNELSRSAKGQKPSADAIAASKKLGADIDDFFNKQSQLRLELYPLHLKVPNVYSDDTPIGKDDKANKVVRQVGDKPEFDFKPKEHFEVESVKEQIDIERAAKVAGSRNAYLKGNIVKLQFALIQFALGLLTDEAKLKEIIKKTNLKVSSKPFVPVLTPVLLRQDALLWMGRLDPKEDKYLIEDEMAALAGSAEQALGPMHADEILEEAELPLRYVGYSTNFRREAGSYGKDVKGILRQHQFDKLEMESFSLPKDGESEQQLLVAIQEHLMNQLGLAYQVVAISSGDMGKPDFRQFDIETWMPGQNKYRETQTADYVTDFQARRLKVRTKSAGQTEFVHMNDATALAMGRTLIAIIENYQTKDGKVRVPEVLKPYMGGEEYL